MTAMPSTDISGDWGSRRRSGRRSLLLWSISLLAAAGISAGGTMLYLGRTVPDAPIQAADAPAVSPRAVNLPHMQLQAQYGGPLMHTLLQRWRDPIDGTVCYIYLPIEVHHSKPTSTGYVEYDSGSIGSVSCLPAPSQVVRKAPSP